MAKKKVRNNRNYPVRLYTTGGPTGGANWMTNINNSKFGQFMQSDGMQNLNKGMGAYNASQGQGGTFLGMNSAAGGSGSNPIGQAVDMTGQMFTAIDNLTKSKRAPLGETVGLVDSYGNRTYANGGNLFATGGDYMQAGMTGVALAGNAIEQAKIEDTSDLKNQIKNYGNVQVKADNYDDLMSDWANRTELQHISARDLRNKTVFGDFANSLSASGQGFSAGSAFGSAGGIAGGIIGGVSSVVGSIFGGAKARREARRVNHQIDIANARNQASYENKADNIESQNDLNTLANFSAFGGLINTFDNGGIYIKPSNRGKFTASANRAGMGVQEFASHVLANKDDYSSTQVKRANFARNFGGKRHSNGGYLEGHTYDLDEKEIRRLESLGYELDY